jgi:HTH-type transcriptional regulator, competence development regulator
MDSLGETIRKLREDMELPLRTVAAYLDIDQAILSKIERGLRNANREQVIKLAEFFKVKENDLLVSWLSDKLVYEVADEEVALEALQVAEEKVKYRLNHDLPDLGISMMKTTNDNKTAFSPTGENGNHK